MHGCDEYLSKKSNFWEEREVWLLPCNTSFPQKESNKYNRMLGINKSHIIGIQVFIMLLFLLGWMKYFKVE